MYQSCWRFKGVAAMWARPLNLQQHFEDISFFYYENYS
jgi:hypothetical protein